MAPPPVSLGIKGNAFSAHLLMMLELILHSKVLQKVNLINGALFRTGILEELLQQEDRVLDHWTQKKKRLDQCLQYVMFEVSARQVWLI